MYTENGFGKLTDAKILLAKNLTPEERKRKKQLIVMYMLNQPKKKSGLKKFIGTAIDPLGLMKKDPVRRAIARAIDPLGLTKRLTKKDSISTIPRARVLRHDIPSRAVETIEQPVTEEPEEMVSAPMSLTEPTNYYEEPMESMQSSPALLPAPEGDYDPGSYARSYKEDIEARISSDPMPKIEDEYAPEDRPSFEESNSVEDWRSFVPQISDEGLVKKEQEERGQVFMAPSLIEEQDMPNWEDMPMEKYDFEGFGMIRNSRNFRGFGIDAVKVTEPSALDKLATGIEKIKPAVTAVRKQVQKYRKPGEQTTVASSGAYPGMTEKSSTPWLMYGLLAVALGGGAYFILRKKR